MPSALCTPLHIDNRLCFRSNSCHTASCPRSRPLLRFTHTRALKHLRLRDQTKRVQKSADVVATASLSLGQLDSILRSSDPEAEAKALDLIQDLKAEGLVQAYGGAQQVPKRIYTLEELRLNNVKPEEFLSPEDSTLNNVRTILQVSGLAGVTALYFAFHLSTTQALALVVLVMFGVVADQVGNAGSIEGLVVDTAGRFISKSYSQRVALHEAGHFLIAYLVGLLPKTYTLSALDALQRGNNANIQAGTQFCDRSFQDEMAKGSISSVSLDKYTCVALSGVAAEYLTFGRAEGGLGDVHQLDALLQAIGFTQKKADGQVRWAVLNVTTILRRYKQTHEKLAKAMADGQSVASCIGIIEDGHKSTSQA